MARLQVSDSKGPRQLLPEVRQGGEMTWSVKCLPSVPKHPCEKLDMGTESKEQQKNPVQPNQPSGPRISEGARIRN